jgi:hypothetical protein
MTEFTPEQEKRIKELVNEALIEFFSAKGSLTKNFLIATATIIGSIVIIGGGLKWILGFIGFTYISK